MRVVRRRGRFQALVGVAALVAALAAAGCGSSGTGTTAGGRTGATTGARATTSSHASTTATRPAASGTAAATAAAAGSNHDWPLFGLTNDRPNSDPTGAGLRAASVRSLRRVRLDIPGTVDSSPIYLHAVRVAGAVRDVFVVTTTYGRTLALDASSGRTLWTYTPPGTASLQGTARITNASPAADPGRQFVFTASPDGRVHRLALANGGETRSGGWPVTITRDPAHEKLTSSFNVSGRLLLVATGGYFGDAPPYQGHVVAIDRSSGRIRGIFNALCSNVHQIMSTRSCPASDAAIWARSGAVVEPGTRDVLIATGNGPFNGRTNWGQSVLRLSPNAQRLLGHWTPSNQAALSASDSDLGSSGPALAGNLIVQAGKDARIHVLTRSLREVQDIPAPGGGEVFSAPAVWRNSGRTTVFVTTSSATAAYAVQGSGLRQLWQHGRGGTSPIVAGGLLLVQDPGGGLVVYRAATGAQVAVLATGSGHWQSPVPGGGRILVAEGNANDHSSGGTLSLFVP
jgi:outer membrane protein assembly factor BamB